MTPELRLSAEERFVQLIHDYIAKCGGYNIGNLREALRLATIPHSPEPSDALKFERDEAADRDYIPLGAGWEIHTRGRGSTFRIVDGKTGDRLAVPDSPYLHETLTHMAREVNAMVRDAERYRQALESIVRHQKIAAPSLCNYSATYCIASDALDPNWRAAIDQALAGGEVAGG